ncbi:hypothetical protein INR49_016486, partial [Caranx melampygus]
MDRWRGRVALVTGASVGIGAAVARELVRSGMKVVGCARDVDKIQKLSAECQTAGLSGVLVPFKCDLTNEEEILSMFSIIKEQHKGVDVCINNAGLGHSEPFMSGHRVNHNSSAHFYSATKYAVTALTEGLRQELREANTHIRATCISPGVVKTEFVLRFCGNDAEKAAAAYSFEPLKAIDVANAVTYVLSAPPHVQIGDIHMRPVEQTTMSGHRVTHSSSVHFYSATKYAVTALTEGLRQELREANTHIRATCISPGVVKTEFALRLYGNMPKKLLLPTLL